MTSVTREDLMLYCRCDTEEQGNLAELLAASAESYLADEDVLCTAANEGQYTLVIKALTLHWMDHPTLQEVPAGQRRIINKLKLSKGG